MRGFVKDIESLAIRNSDFRQVLYTAQQCQLVVMALKPKDNEHFDGNTTEVIGRMVLNRWPNNFFAENEQVAYCPGNIVPGIDFSNDPLLQGRLFSYVDTQLSRLGSSNCQQELKRSPALQIIGKMKDTLMGRTIGILFTDGSDGAVIKKIEKASTAAGASVKIVASKVGGAKALSKESAAIDFVRDAFGHLKAIAADIGGQMLLKTANVGQDAGVVDVSNKDAFIAAATTRQWDREKSIRTLA